MSDQELKDLVASLAIESKKTDELLKKTDKQLKETDKHLKEADERLTKKLDKIAKMVGAIGNNQGDVAEEYFVNSLKEKLSVAGIKFDVLLSNVLLKTKKVKCKNCGYVFNCVGKRILCPKCKNIFEISNI